MVSADGTVHEGRWVRGALDETLPSKTERTMADGTKYTGGWHNGLPNGKGSIVYANGERFDGMFADGMPDATQPHTVARRLEDGYYVGEMLNSQRHGFGILTHKGDTCEGTWSDGMPVDCNGVLTINGQRYAGACGASPPCATCAVCGKCGARTHCARRSPPEHAYRGARRRRMARRLPRGPRRTRVAIRRALRRRVPARLATWLWRLRVPGR